MRLDMELQNEKGSYFLLIKTGILSVIKVKILNQPPFNIRNIEKIYKGNNNLALIKTYI